MEVEINKSGVRRVLAAVHATGIGLP